MQRLYTGEVRYLDENFAKLLAKLRELGLYDDALIVLTADHGEEFHEHGGFWHGLTLYDEQIHVPLLIKWPKGAPGAPPSARGHLARHIDVAPTLLARAGITPPAAMQGIDLVTPRRRARREGPPRRSPRKTTRATCCARCGRPKWKLIEANPGNPRGLAPEELFQVAADPGETRNLIGEQTGQAQSAAIAGGRRAAARAQPRRGRRRRRQALRRPAGSPEGARLRSVV